MDERRERTPRRTNLDRQFFNRLSIAQLLRIVSIILEELLHRLHISRDSVDYIEVQLSDPPEDPENPPSTSSIWTVSHPAPRTPEI